MEKKKLTPENAHELLADSEFLHVIKVEDVAEDFHWQRQKVLAFIHQYGVQLASRESVKATHGICSSNGRAIFFFETKRASS